MAFLWLFDTTGWIFGPLIWLTGLVALWLCLRASARAATPRARRAAVVGSVLPLAAGACAALVGLFVFWSSGQPAAGRSIPWWALGKAFLAGLVVAAVPLAWSLFLLRARRDPSGPAVAGP